jgi:hypothetical protein
MADYAITSVARRVVYTGSAGVGPYAFTFPVLVNTDIAVYKNTTLLTLTTDYTVTISGTTGQGSITLVVAATGDDRITIVGARSIQRSTDFVTGGDFFANTLNTELDSEVIFVQQVAETAERSIKAPVTDPTSIDMTLPFNTVRANKFLSFNSSGNPQALDAIGTYKGNWAASVAYVLQDVVKDTSNNNIYICITAHTSTGAQPISSNADVAKWSLVVDAASASTSATNAASSASAASTSATNAAASASTASTQASNASTSATNAATSASSAATALTATEAARDSALAAYDNFDDRYLGAKSSDPTLDNDGNALLAGALYYNTVSVEIRLYTGSAWVAAYVSGSGFLAASNNLSDLASNTTARTNLGLGTIATVAAPSGTVVGTTDTQTLTNKTISGSSNTISNIGLSTQVTGTLPVANGGTALTTYTTGDLPYASATNTLTKLGVGSTGQVLTVAGGVPTWASASATGTLVGYNVYTSSTSYAKATNNPTFVIVEVVGGGGNGGASGGNQFVGSAAAGQGGGGGGYARKRILASALAASETVTVGGAGATSSFGSFVSATGGGAGPANGGTPGAGGSGSGGDINVTASTALYNPSNSVGGFGGASGLGYGGFMIGAIGGGSAVAGNNGSVYGGGASGAARASNNTNASGGTGASGLVIVWEYK